MDINSFTNKSREAISAAQNIAARYHHQQIEPGHLLLALLEQEAGLTPRILSKANIDVGNVKEQVESYLDKQPKVYAGEGTAEQLYLSPKLARVLDRATREASSFKDEYVSTEHLLLALVEEDSGEVKRILKNAGLNRNLLLEIPQSIRGGTEGYQRRSGEYLRSSQQVW